MSDQAVLDDAPRDVHESGWQWRPVGNDGAFAPPFGTIRVCRVCGCLVAGGPTVCGRCATVVKRAPVEHDTPPPPTTTASDPGKPLCGRKGTWSSREEDWTCPGCLRLVVAVRGKEIDRRQAEVDRLRNEAGRALTLLDAAGAWRELPADSRKELAGVIVSGGGVTNAAAKRCAIMLLAAAEEMK